MNIIRYSCQILMKFAFSKQIFEKYTDIQFHENPSSGSRVVPCEGTDQRTDGKTETIRRTHMMKLSVVFSKFCEFA